MIGNDEVDEHWWSNKLKLNNDKLIRKKAWEKRKEQVFGRGSWLIHRLQNMSHHKIYTFWHCVFREGVPSTSSQIVEQIEVIQGVVLPGISRLNQLSKHNFLQKNFKKRKMDLILPVIFSVTPTDVL